MGKQRANRRSREARPHYIGEEEKFPTKPQQQHVQARSPTNSITSAEIKANARAAWNRGDNIEALKLEQQYRDQLLLEASEREQSSDEVRRRNLLIQAKEQGWLSGGVGIEDDMRPFFEAAKMRRMVFPS